MPSISSTGPGGSYSEVAAALGELAAALGRAGDAAAAPPLLERALRILESHHGPKYGPVTRALASLGLAQHVRSILELRSARRASEQILAIRSSPKHLSSFGEPKQAAW